MKRVRPAMPFFFTATLTVLAMLTAILSLPVSSYAFGANPPLRNTSAPGQGTCASCHGTVMAGSGVTVNAPSSYTPGGAAVSMTVSIPSTGGFELEVGTQSSNAQAGNLTTADPNAAVSLVSGIQYAFSSSETTSWTFSWTPPATNVGNVVLYVTGGGRSPNYSKNFVMTAAAAATPNFSLSASPSTVAITQGASGTDTLTVTPQNGFTGSIALSASGLPSGVTFNPSSITGTSPLTFTASSTATAGTFPVTLTGTSGSLSHTASFRQTINPAVVQTPNFGLSASPSSLTIAQGSGGSSTVTVAPSNGFTGSVALSASGLPSGVTASFNPASATGPSTLTLNASSAATAGTGTVTITGTSGTLSHTATLSLTVTGTGVQKPDFGISASPSSLSIKQGSSGSSMITLVPSNGFNGNVSLSIPGLPSGVTASFSPPSTMGSSTLTLTASSTAASLTATLTISGMSGSLSRSTTVTLTVTPATGTSALAASPSSLTFNYQSGGSMPPSQGLKITDTGGAVSYSASSSGGPWLTTSPNSGNTPGTMMVSVDPTNMSAGSYSGMIQLSGTGTKTSMVPVTLNITSGRPRGCEEDCGGGNGGGGSNMYAEPYVNDPNSSGTLTATWVDLLGMPTSNQSSTGNPGLVVSKLATAPGGSQAGALIRNVQGSLTELGFDYRDGGQCTATSPRFIVVTADSATHVVGGCSKGTITAAPMMGWKRVRFKISDTSIQSSPAILPGDTVSSITLVLDQGPEAGSTAAGGLVVIDNIDINGSFAGKGASAPSYPRYRRGD